jgi:hypothetical protein
MWLTKLLWPEHPPLLKTSHYQIDCQSWHDENLPLPLPTPIALQNFLLLDASWMKWHFVQAKGDLQKRSKLYFKFSINYLKLQLTPSSFIVN